MILRGQIEVGDVIRIDEATTQVDDCNLYITHCRGEEIFDSIKGLKFNKGERGLVVKIIRTLEKDYVVTNMSNGYCCITTKNSTKRINRFRKGDLVTKIFDYSFNVGKGDVVTVDKYSIGADSIFFTIDECNGAYNQDAFIKSYGFKIGDRVKIIDSGKQYTSYSDFYNVSKCEDSFEFIREKSHMNGDIGTIMNIQKHLGDEDTILALLNMDDRCSAIINLKGLEKIEHDITNTTIKGEFTMIEKQNETLKEGLRIMRLTERGTFNTMPKYSIATIARVFEDRVYTNEYIGALNMDEFVIVKDKTYSELKNKIKEQADKKENLRKMNRKTIREQANKIESLQAQLNKYKPKKKRVDDDTLNEIISVVNKDGFMEAYVLGDTITCELKDMFGKVLATGKARKHPNDNFDLDTGLTLAFIRAIKNDYENKEKEIIKSL